MLKHSVPLGCWGAGETGDDLGPWKQEVRIVWFHMEAIYLRAHWHSSNICQWLHQECCWWSSSGALTSKRFSFHLSWLYQQAKSMLRNITTYIEVAISTRWKIWPWSLAHMLEEKLLKQPFVTICIRLESIHSPCGKSHASISVIAYMEFQKHAFWKTQAFFSLRNQLFL